ncbi:MAG: L-fuculose-phosphate aldolase [Synergistaceae bacterium]|jgi:L-fuculose-phosphate aldolase|nr:L-fuculose-phosphate aldolase [Synergistaceae bacterium]
MQMQEEREAIIEHCKKLITHGLTVGTGGNISVFNTEYQLMAISPSGMDYFTTKPEDIVLTDLDGKVVEGDRKPSTEVDMHRIYYNMRKDVRAVVHCHSMYSTVLASLRMNLPAVNNYIAIAGGYDIRCAEYGTGGTWTLAENSFRAMEGRYACFLANHGLLTCAADLPSAFMIAEEVERMAEAYYHAKLLGEPVVLDNSEVDVILNKNKNYGQVTQK